MSISALKDLTGQRFGQLVVIERDENRIWQNGKQAVYWRCLCDCGNITSVHSSNLLCGQVIRCRKCSRIAAAKKHTKDLTGQRFGHLVVIDTSKKKSDKRHRLYWRCVCDCGAETIVSGNNLKNGSITSCGCIKSKGEEIIKKSLCRLGLDYKQEFSFCDLKAINYLRFDFAIFSNNNLVCLIEFQGIQHYQDLGEFGKQQRETTDQMKRDYCAVHSIPLYEIAYDENVEQRLDEILEDLKQTHNIDLATIYDNTVPSQSEVA